MSALKLHIVCFTIPYPVTYGGVFDLFYKLEALQNVGIAIDLHCIQYGENKTQPILEKYCANVFYYKRKKTFPIRFSGLPYIVESRIIREIIHRLNQDNAPILMEGIHSTGIIPYLPSAPRNLLIRICNVEYIYYQNLANTTPSFLKKLYYKTESSRLKNWESQLVDKGYFFSTLSLLDKKIYQEQLQCDHISYIPLFLPDWKVTNQEGRGQYCLYQGNLDVAENQQAIKWLINDVFKNLSIPLFIAGKSNGSFVKKMRSLGTKITWIENPTEEKMQQLISEAQIHLLPSFNATGIKLKLLNALYNGRFCIANTAMVQDSGLESLCIVADTVANFREKISLYYDRSFDNREQEARQKLLTTIFDNNKNAICLKNALFDK